MKVQNGVLVIIFAFCFIFSPVKIFSQALKVNWNDNKEPDLAGYKLFCGTEHSMYSFVFNVGFKKPVYIDGLQDGSTYYFAVRAYDWSDNESAFSSEVNISIPENASNELINLSLNPAELHYQFNNFYPQYSEILKNDLLGIQLEIPAGATSYPITLAIGGSINSVESPSEIESGSFYYEFDIEPYSIEFLKSATVSVPLNGTKNVWVEQFDEELRSWVFVRNVSIDDGVVKFPTKVLGKFKIYSFSGNINPYSQLLGGGEENGNSSGSSGGGGGCFIGTSGDYTDGPGIGIPLAVFSALFALFVPLDKKRFARF